MKQADIELGEVYLLNKGGTLLLVRIVMKFNNAYKAIDLSTGKSVYISSARRLRQLDDK